MNHSMIISTALLLNLAGIITNCRPPCIANPVSRLYAIDIENNKECTVRIGIDLGGTKTEVIALGEHGEQCFRHRLPTPRDDYQQTIETIATLVGMAEKVTRQRGTVGVGIPGSISPYTGVVKNANSTWLNGQPFDKDLSVRLQREVRLANDANCLAVSEAVDGAAAGAQTVFAVIIGTGCGAGVALNGRAHIGGNGTAGEWGHNPLPWMDEDELRYRQEVPCYCGKQGCIETFISGTGFATDYQRLSGKQREGSEIIQLVEAKDAIAELALSRYELRLAKSLAHVVNILDPDVIVLGGGMSNVERLYQTVPQLIKSFVFGGECETPLRKARHGDSSGVRGAAWLWPQQDK
nr:fructokinase [Escherichia fergusonii]